MRGADVRAECRSSVERCLHYSSVQAGLGLGDRRWGAWRAHAHFVAFRATLKGDGEQREAAVEELTLRLSRE